MNPLLNSTTGRNAEIVRMRENPRLNSAGRAYLHLTCPVLVFEPPRFVPPAPRPASSCQSDWLALAERWFRS